VLLNRAPQAGGCNENAVMDRCADGQICEGKKVPEWLETCGSGGRARARGHRVHRGTHQGWKPRTTPMRRES